MEASAIVTATPKHIETVRKKIEEIKKSISGHFFDLGEILSEVKDGGFYLTWGYSKFGDWLEKSGLDMSERSAYYLLKIVEMGKALNIPREDLEKVKLSKLREIASLDYAKDEEKVRALLKACTPDSNGEEMSLEDVRNNVQRVKAGDDKIDTFVFLTLKFTQTTKDEVIDPAIEMARALHGDTLGADGQPVDISPGRAIELILADFLAGAEAQAEQVPEEPLPVEQKALPPVLDSEVIDAEIVEAASASLKDALKLVDEAANNPAVVESLKQAGYKIDHGAIAELKIDVSGDDDPLINEVIKLLQEEPESTPNLVKIRLRVGELRAFNLYKAAKAVIDGN